MSHQLIIHDPDHVVRRQKKKVKVAVAMSGGVDSSVAAALLIKEGYDVIGITMRLYDEPERDNHNNGDNCKLNVIHQSKVIADQLNIFHSVADFRDVFKDKIIGYFCREYSMGRTPNPCVRCNELIKFGMLMEKAKELNADYLATGHYARVEQDNISGKFTLKKGIDRHKDQSYFLCRLNQQQLSSIIFPLGSMTKIKIKQIAEDLRIPVKDRSESQEICFITDNNHARFLEEREPGSVRPGPILSQQRDTLGRHTGLHRYTIGQRKGLGIAATEPLYVTAIEAEKNAVIVGSKDLTYGDELTATDINWITIAPPKYPITVKARIRYRHQDAEAVVTPIDNSNVHVKFTRPQMAITPGQTIVLYDGAYVIGGGTINLKGNK